MALKIKVEARPNVYGFGRDWALIVTKGKKKKSFWLGQSVKVCSRLLGQDMDSLIREAEQKFGTREFDNPLLNKWLGELILSAMYDTNDLKAIEKDIFKRQVWELAVE